MHENDRARPDILLLSIPLFLGAFLLRLYGIGGLPYDYDEPFFIQYMSQISRRFQEWPLYSFQHPPLSLYIMRFGSLVLGGNNYGYRIVNVIVGAASVFLIVYLATLLTLPGSSKTSSMASSML